MLQGAEKREFTLACGLRIGTQLHAKTCSACFSHHKLDLLLRRPYEHRLRARVSITPCMLTLHGFAHVPVCTLSLGDSSILLAARASPFPGEKRIIGAEPRFWCGFLSRPEHVPTVPTNPEHGVTPSPTRMPSATRPRAASIQAASAYKNKRVWIASSSQLLYCDKLACTTLHDELGCVFNGRFTRDLRG
jgi:hypothetical protein